jgi:hypothetical protein
MISTITVEWPISGRCEKPVMIETWEPPLIKSGKSRTSAQGSPSRTYIEAPCRQCRPCLKARAREWREKARFETVWAADKGCRTWFVTLTLSPEERYRAGVIASRRTKLLRSEEIDGLSARRQFQALHNAVSPWITKWLKRVRKGLASEGETPVRFRYLLIAEEHKDGFPHWHLLMHELYPSEPLLKERMRREWFPRHGFTRFKVVANTDLATWYVTKYATKSSLARVRASVNYGNGLTP